MENWQTIKELFHEAVDIAPDERGLFLDTHCTDPETRREIENLFRAYEESEDFIAEPAVVEAGLIEQFADAEAAAAAASRIGDKIGNYKIVREIGRGGMGAVYLAERVDDEFRQLVALKLVKRGMDTDFILRRFRNERQILAGLNHPNIARLLEGGTTRDGLPYFVMEYVEGVDLISYCQRENLHLDEILHLFRKVCAAVSYAHQNLIVHRDLKPSNILVTSEGVPKLLDFGIAKLLNNDSDNLKTTSFLRLFTPEYASPEQIRGEQITTASDIYSLGVILYQILTARNPFQAKNKSYDEIVRAVCETMPERPSSVVSGQWSVGSGQWAVFGGRTDQNSERRTINNEPGTNPKPKIQNPKSLRGDLDNIVIKALQKTPARRYSSVEEFSEDIRRYQRGLPVKAQPDRFGYRAAKFVKRHRVGVFAGLLIFLSMLGGIAATGWQAYRANIERAKAERRFMDVRGLSNSLMLDVHDAIKDLPGSTPARQLLVKRALIYLDKIAQEAADGADPVLQSDLAIAFERVGDVQGNPQTSNLGDTTGALESYRKALAIRENLPPEIQNSAGEKYGAAMLYGKIFQAAAFQLDMRTAETYCRRALDLLEDLAAEEPENVDYRAALANVYSQLGELKKKDRRFEEALAHLKETIEISNEILRRDQANAAALSNVQLAWVRIGEIYEIEKNAPAALAAYEAALAAAKKSAELYPQKAPLDLVLGISFGKVGYAQVAMGNAVEAMKNSRAGLQILQKIVAADPANTFADRQLACAYKNVGLAHLQSGDPNEALENFQTALAIKEKLRRKDRSDVYLQGDIGEIFAFHGDAYRKAAISRINFQSKREDLNNAKNWYQRSLAIWTGMQKEGKLPQYYSSKPDELITSIARCDEALRNHRPVTPAQTKKKY